MRISKRIIAFFSLFCLVSVLLFVVLEGTVARRNAGNIIDFIRDDFNLFALYQNFANPYIRYVRIPEGLRKEQVADIYSKVLAWNDQDVDRFLSGKSDSGGSLEGYYYPSTYILPVDASGEEVREKMIQTFNQKVVSVTESKKYVLDKDKVNMDTILKIASLIQREAAGKHDMNLISGIIWNRIWNGMSLDIDATLQYAKGTDEEGWWPQVKSKDKNIESPYNTYKNIGLPPTPISNPGLAAIEAAYNPQKTNCIFYFHDDNRKIHCSVTYAEHKRGVEAYLR